MIDLAARVHYKVHFDIVRRYTGTSLFDEVIYVIYGWLNRKYENKIRSWNWQQVRKFGEFSAADHTVYAKTTSFTDDNGLLNWACKIDEFEPSKYEEDEDYLIEKAPRIWTSEFGFQQTSAERATISYVVYYRDKPGFIGTTDDLPANNVPRFVKDLLFHKKLDCFIGPDKLYARDRVIHVGEGKTLTEMISREDRLVPIILVAPDDSQGEELVYPVSARAIANNVMGNALVYSLDSIGALEEMMYFMENHRFAPRRSQIMVYWPLTSPLLKKCRYITASQASALGEGTIVNILRRVFSNDINYTDSREMFRIEDCEELFKQKRVNELRTKMTTIKAAADRNEATNAELKEDVGFMEEYAKTVEEENKYKQDAINNLTNQRDDMKRENWKLQQRIEYLEKYQSEARGIKQSLEAIRGIDELPQSPTDVALFFKNVFQDKLDFTERGMKSLEDCTTRTDIVWQCLYAMASTLTDIYRNGTADIEAAFRTKTGWDMARGEGTQTRKDKDLMNLRKDTYQGREILIEPHVRNGTRESSPDFIRIYFCFDKETQKIVIGHVGSHLENFSSQNV